MSASFYRDNLKTQLVRSLAITPKQVDKIELWGALRECMTECAFVIEAIEQKRPITDQDWKDIDQALLDGARNVAAFRGRPS